MQRINISIDLENNEIFAEEIEKAITGAVKAKTREYFHSTIETEVLRIADKAAEKLFKKRGTWGDKPSAIEQTIESYISEKVEKTIGEIKISKADIQKEIDKKMENIEYMIAKEVAKRIEHISFEDYISGLVEKEIQKALPQKVLDLIIRGIEKQ